MDELRGGLPPPARDAIGHLLVDEAGGVAIDVRAGLSRAARAAGIRHATPADLVPHLLALDAHLGDAEVVRLDLSDAGIEDSDAAALAGAGWFASVRVLDLTASCVGASGLAAIARTGRALQVVNLSSTRLGTAVGALDGLDALVRLELGFTGLGDDGLRVLADLSLPRLQHLGLAGATAHASLAELREPGAAIEPVSEFRAKQLEALLDGPIGASLTSLDLSRVRLKAPVAARLGAAELGKLARLDLSECRMTDKALARALGRARWPVLEELRLRRTWPGDHGPGAAVRALIDAEPLARLQRLDLAGNQLPARALCEVVARGAGLRGLRVNGNQLDAAGLQALVQSDAGRRLELLTVGQNPVGPRACPVLAAAPLELHRLGLAQLAITDADLEVLCQAPWLGGVSRIDLRGNELTDASIETLAIHLADAHLRLANNRFTAEGFARLREQFGDRASGARHQAALSR